MSTDQNVQLTRPDLGPAIAAAALGIPTLVVLVLAVVLNWGR